MGDTGRQDYTDKAHQLLADSNTYRLINKDPTNKLKNKLAQTCRDIKLHGGLSDSRYKRIYPTSAVLPKFYEIPKIHKGGTPLGPLFQTGVPSLMGWPRNWPTSSDP